MSTFGPLASGYVPASSAAPAAAAKPSGGSSLGGLAAGAAGLFAAATGGIGAIAAPLIGGLASGLTGSSDPGPMIMGPSNFRSAGINIGSKVVGSGSASTDQRSQDSQSAGDPAAAGASPTMAAVQASNQRLGTIIVGILAGLLLIGGLVFAMRRKAKPAAKPRRK